MMSEQQLGLYEALAAAQGEIIEPEKTKEGQAGQGKFKYADLAEVLKTVRPTLKKYGLSVVQLSKISDGKVSLITRLAHKSGEYVESEYPVSDVVAKHQVMGASMTYARRYALSAILGISSVEDTDKEGTEDAHDRNAIRRLSSDRAKKILNYDDMVAEIDSATHKQLDFLENFYRKDCGWLPGGWAPKFIERIEQRRNELQDIDIAATEAAVSANESLDRQFKDTVR